MEIEIILLFAGITILSLILLTVTLYSFKKTRNNKLIFVSLIFLFLFVRGFLLSFGLFNDQIASLTSSDYIWVFDLITLILLYVAYSIKR